MKKKKKKEINESNIEKNEDSKRNHTGRADIKSRDDCQYCLILSSRNNIDCTDNSNIDANTNNDSTNNNINKFHNYDATNNDTNSDKNKNKYTDEIDDYGGIDDKDCKQPVHQDRDNHSKSEENQTDEEMEFLKEIVQVELGALNRNSNNDSIDNDDKKTLTNKLYNDANDSENDSDSKKNDKIKRSETTCNVDENGCYCTCDNCKKCALTNKEKQSGPRGTQMEIKQIEESLMNLWSLLDKLQDNDKVRKQLEIELETRNLDWGSGYLDPRYYIRVLRDKRRYLNNHLDETKRKKDQDLSKIFPYISSAPSSSSSVGYRRHKNYPNDECDNEGDSKHRGKAKHHRHRNRSISLSSSRSPSNSRSASRGASFSTLSRKRRRNYSDDEHEPVVHSKRKNRDKSDYDDKSKQKKKKKVEKNDYRKRDDFKKDDYYCDEDHFHSDESVTRGKIKKKYRKKDRQHLHAESEQNIHDNPPIDHDSNVVNDDNCKDDDNVTSDVVNGSSLPAYENKDPRDMDSTSAKINDETLVTSKNMKKTIPKTVNPLIRSKLQLVERWKLKQQQVEEEEEKEEMKRENAEEEKFKRQMKKLDEWKEKQSQRIGSNRNSNFIEVSGDWRELVKENQSKLTDPKT